MKTLAFFNNKGGVGKTSLVYHLAWMFGELGKTVLAADLDPQANLTAMFLDEDRMEEVWAEPTSTLTLYSAMKPLLDGTGDISEPHVEIASRKLGLLMGDLALSSAEDELSSQWPQCLDAKPRAFRVLSALSRMMERAAAKIGADLILIDVGPNLGALNRAALISAEYVAIPLASDLYSLQGLRNLGPTLRKWRDEWQERLKKAPDQSIALPQGEMEPIGYIVLQHAVRLDRPVKAYDRWLQKIPTIYRETVLVSNEPVPSLARLDVHCLAMLKHYRSLMPLAQEAHKPMFFLRAADGAIGGHAQAVSDCYSDFKALAKKIASQIGLDLP